MDEITKLEPKPPWERQSAEPEHEYAWFVKYAELGDQRSIEKVSSVQGVPLELVAAAADRNAWESRAKAYDATVIDVMEHVVVDDTKALAMQYAVGIAMMQLGVQAVSLKNPALIRMKDVQALMQQGAEMARRGAGVADLKVDHDVVKRVENLVAGILD